MENVLDLCSAEGEDADRVLASGSPDAEDLRRVHGVAENYRRARSLYEQGTSGALVTLMQVMMKHITSFQL